MNVLNPAATSSVPPSSTHQQEAGPATAGAQASIQISDIGDLQIVTASSQVQQDIYETQAVTDSCYVDVEDKEGRRIRLKVPQNTDPATYGREYLESLER